MILDMHAAPGGQTGANIDNSENDHPDLFTNELYQEQLCYIWKVIADRYKDESMVAAYDLLNEPLPKIFSQYNDQLMPLYKRIIQSIREVDKNHMITVEGLHWATDFSCFNEVLDDNIMLHFHKYWSNPDQAGIQAFLDKREVLNVPIFMGEGGENSLAWYYAAFKLYEQHNISTNFWAYKKMETNNSIISFKKPDHWEEFLEGALNEKESISVLDQLIEYISFDQTIVREDCINHVLGKNTLHIPAYGFDYVGKDQVFHVNKKHKTSLRKNDGISITDLKGNVIEPNFWNRNEQSALQVNLEKGEWVSYTFDLDADIKTFTISLEGSSSTYMLYLNDQKIHAHTVYEPSSFKGNKYWLKVIADKDTNFEWVHINCQY